MNNFLSRPLSYNDSNDKFLTRLNWNCFQTSNMELMLAKVMVLAFERVENIVGKGENAAYKHFLLFSQCFQKPSFLPS